MPRLWLNVAKNEIRLWSSRFRNHRPLLFLIIGLIVIIYAFVLVPLIISTFADLVKPFLLFAGPYFMFYVFSIALLYIFIYCITYPLSTMLQTAQDLGGQLEILLATPVKAQDILFGKFIARLPTYSILLFGMAPWLVNIFAIAFPLSIFQQILVYLVLFGVIIMGMWLGTLLASYLESKVRRSERSRDLGRAMTFIITIVSVALMYGLIWIVMSGLNNPFSPLYTILQVFPSTWGTIIVMNIFGISNEALLISVNIGIFIALLIGVTVITLYFGYKAAGRFYSLEPTEMGTERIVREGWIYRMVRGLIPGDSGVQVVSQLKQFSRKMENFSRIGYAVGLSAIIIIFQSIANGEAAQAGIGFISMFATYMPALMMAGLLGTWVIIGSKDNLWIYKKAPNGVSRYVKSVYIVHLIYTVPIGLIFVGILTAALGGTLVNVLLNMGILFLFLLSLMAMAIGLAFIFPTFEERGSKVGLLMMSFFGITIGIMIGAMVLVFGVFASLGEFTMPIICLIFTIPIGIALLKLGITKLKALE
jgi:hypothetical protein